MSQQYTAILWNPQKRRYDLMMAVLIVTFLILFVSLNLLFQDQISIETLIIRAFGILALLLLHIILTIGPLSRIDSRFLVLLYNRRHIGVTMFIMALIHGIFSIIQFHGFSNENPIISVFTSNTSYDSLLDFPFQTLGFFALVILLIMAATSHDFWLKNLSPKVWKGLHMGVYLAYALIVFHVMLGAAQNETSIYINGLMLAGVTIVSGLHIYASRISSKVESIESNWIAVGSIEEIPDNGAKTIHVNSQKIAVFKYDNKLSAVSNYCRHQGGPLGEGKVIDGCITCPWHGYQYYPHDGCSPPPFEEKIETFQLKMEGDKLLVNTNPNAAGTAVDPITFK